MGRNLKAIAKTGAAGLAAQAARTADARQSYVDNRRFARTASAQPTYQPPQQQTSSWQGLLQQAQALAPRAAPATAAAQAIAAAVPPDVANGLPTPEEQAALDAQVDIDTEEEEPPPHERAQEAAQAAFEAANHAEQREGNPHEHAAAATTLAEGARVAHEQTVDEAPARAPASGL